MVSEIVGVQNRNSTDRRQMALPVEFDRRSGVDRRTVAEKRDNTSVFRALEVIPTVRRVSSLPDKLNNGDIVPALGLASLALINVKEDCRDIQGAINQLRGQAPLYNHQEFQHSFSFFRGTAIEKWLHKQIDAGKKWAKWLYENDKTLADTKFGEKIIDKMGIEENAFIKTSIKDCEGECAYAVSYGNSFLKELTGRALRRTTLLGVGALALIELPKIIKSDEKIKQTVKSAANVASITAGIAYGGAIGFKYFGNVGSLAGMGFGAILGSKLSKKAQEVI